MRVLVYVVRLTQGKQTVTWNNDGKNTTLHYKSEPANHHVENSTHSFSWKLIDAPLNNRKRKNLEALIIAIKRPFLNEQVESKML